MFNAPKSKKEDLNDEMITDPSELGLSPEDFDFNPERKNLEDELERLGLDEKSEGIDGIIYEAMIKVVNWSKKITEELNNPPYS